MSKHLISGTDYFSNVVGTNVERKRGEGGRRNEEEGRSEEERREKRERGEEVGGRMKVGRKGRGGRKEESQDVLLPKLLIP